MLFNLFSVIIISLVSILVVVGHGKYFALR